MNIIEIKPLSNGAHNNQFGSFKNVPSGYAQIPDDMSIPDTFPFVNIEVADEVRYTEKSVYNEQTEEYKTEKIPYTVKVVTSMTEGIVPPVEPVPEPDSGDEPVTWNELAKAYEEGVNSIDE